MKAHVPFPLGLYLWGVALAIGSHWLAEDIHRRLGLWADDLPWAVHALVPLAAMLVAFVVTWLLYRDRARTKSPHGKGPGARAMRSAGVLLAFSGIFVASVWAHELIPTGKTLPLVGLLALLLVLLALSERFEHSRALFARPLTFHRVLAADPSVTRFRAMLVCVSTPNIVPQTGTLSVTVSFPSQPVTLSGADLRADIDALDAGRWNWQQLLRAIEPHRATLRQVWLIGSADEKKYAQQDPKLRQAHMVPGACPPPGKGSFSYLDEAQALLELYLPAARVQRWGTALDFEDFDRMVEVFREIVHEHVDKTIPPSSIAVEVTGGQKTASIAGAATTLFGESVFQYVQTQGGCEPWRYDVRLLGEP